jgi:transcriptional regulator with XRE-family HTH domain
MKKNSLGILVKQQREGLGLSQRALAERVGVKASHIAYIEGGKRKPSLALMTRLADSLGIGRQQLFVLAHPEAESVVNPIVNVAAPDNPQEAWRQFVNDRAFLERHRVTRRELRAFKEISLLGYVLSKREFLGVLAMIRG